MLREDKRLTRRNASSCTSRGGCQASTTKTFTCISHAMGFSASRLSRVQLGSGYPDFDNVRIAVDFTNPVLALRPKWEHESFARRDSV